MISYIRGEIIFQDEKSIIVKVDNLGFQIFTNSLFLAKIREKKINQVELYTCLYVRKENMELYGFESLEELGFFKKLLAVSGVGPRSALHILSLASLSEIKKAIVNNQPVFLTRVSGVGRKIAERVVMELRDKIDDLSTGAADFKPATEDEEVLDALLRLGYKIFDAREVLRKIPQDLESAEEKLKAALRLLAR